MHRRTADRILFYPILTQHIIDAPCSSTDAQYCNTVCIDNQVRCVKLMLCCTQHHHALMYRALPYAVAAVATVPYCTRACALRTHDDDGVVKRGSVDAVRQMVDECAI